MKNKLNSLIVLIVLAAACSPAKAELLIKSISINKAEPIKANKIKDIKDLAVIANETDEIASSSEDLESELDDLAAQIKSIGGYITSVESRAENISPGQEELNKFNSGTIDVSTKEYYRGQRYDVDIFDHGKSLAEHDKENFYSKYLN